MKREQVEKMYCFCYEGKIIVIKEMEAKEVPYCKMCFLRLLNKLWHQKSSCPTADVVLKEALELYTGAKLYRLYKGKVLSDDELYLTLRDLVKEKYSEYFSQEQERRQEELERLHKYQREANQEMYSGRERQYKFRRKPKSHRK